MYKIIKRNSDVVDFQLDKISTAIRKAMDACGRLYDENILSTLALKAASMAERRVVDGSVAVEDVQDCVEQVLSESGYFDVARSYILYRDQHKKLRQAKNTLLDYQKTVDNYLKTLDWRVKESSTITYSLGGLILGNSGAITANYWLSEVYDEEVANAHRDVRMHIHDLSMLSPYCAGWNLKDLIERGIVSVGGRTASKPAAHLSTLANQMVNFLGILQNEWAGAQAFSSFDTYLAPFVKADRLTYEQVKQAIQSFVFGVNTPSRWGCVDTDTEVLSVDGFKKYDELKEGDWIYTWSNGRLELNQVNKVIQKPFKGKLHAYVAQGYNQTVTPNHRMLVKMDGESQYGIRLSEDIISQMDRVSLPTAFGNHASVITELLMWPGTLYDEYSGRVTIPTFGDPARADLIQRSMLEHGFCSYCDHDMVIVNFNQTEIKPTAVATIDYDGIVWCPNVENGTAVFRKDGCVYISGQTQPPFTNITLDWTVPDDLKNQPAIVGGKEMPFTYGDCKAEMDVVNKAFIDVMLEGDANGRGHEYPIPTYSITPDFDWSDTENNKMLFGMAAKYGIPYFSNYVNSDMKPSDIRSMCCRLRLDLNELRRRNGGFFGSGESTGSIGVVTINLPQLAYLSASEQDFFIQLDHLMDVAARSLDTKRRAVAKWLDAGLYPYTKVYLGHFNNHFSTIGLVGMNEACLNARWIRRDMTDKKSQEFAVKVLKHMRDRLVIYQNRYKALFNLEATPAESTAYRFAKHDKERYPDIVTANMNGTPYYTNSTNLPVGYTDDIFKALDVQDELQVLYTSGTVFHTFLGEQMPDWRSTMSLVRKIAQNYKLPYYTLSPTYSICPDHGYLAGEQHTCPHCGKTTEVFSRITGYYRAVQNWNDGKAQEFEDRKTYDKVLRGEGLNTDRPVRDTCGEADGCPPDFDDEPMDHCGQDGCRFDVPDAAMDDDTDHCGPNGCSFETPDGDACGPDGCCPGIMDDAEILPDSYPVPDGLDGGTFILKTRTCAKCRALDRMLQAKGINVKPIYAEDFIDWVKAIGAFESPTLIKDGLPVAHGVQAVAEALSA